MFSKAVKERAWKRSGGLCERKLLTGKRCLAPGAEFHHIVLRSHVGRKLRYLLDSEYNCMVVCLGCHQERHEGGGWNDDAAELVPVREVRQVLRQGIDNRGKLS